LNFELGTLNRRAERMASFGKISFPCGAAEDAEMGALNVEPGPLNSGFARMSLLSYHDGTAAMGRHARGDFHRRKGIRGPKGLPSKKQNKGKIISAGRPSNVQILKLSTATSAWLRLIKIAHRLRLHGPLSPHHPFPLSPLAPSDGFVSQFPYP
jgi:hypothetical protein